MKPFVLFLTTVISLLCFYSFSSINKPFRPNDMDWNSFSINELSEQNRLKLVEELNSLENYAAFKLDYDQVKPLIKGRSITDVNKARAKVKAFYDSNTVLVGKNGMPLQYWILDRTMILDALKKNRLTRYGGLAAYPALDSDGNSDFHTLILQPAENVQTNDSGVVLSHSLVKPNSENLYNFIDPCPISCDESSNNLTNS